MKKVIFIALLMISMIGQAQAAQWRLIHQEFHQNMWICTYQLMGSQYTSTIMSQTYCQSFIFQ